MNDMVPRRPATPALITAPPMPKTSPILSAAIEHAVYAQTVDGESSPPVVIPAHLQPRIAAEAARAADVVRARLEPANEARWRWFLFPLMPVVEFPPTRGDFDDFCASCEDMLSNIPGHLLTVARQREAGRTFRKWPSAAALSAWLEPAARTERATLRALEKIAATHEPTPAQKDATAEAVQQVREKLTAFRREMQAVTREASGTTRPLQAFPLAPDKLAALYRQQAKQPGLEGDLARQRLAALQPRKDSTDE